MFFLGGQRGHLKKKKKKKKENKSYIALSMETWVGQKEMEEGLGKKKKKKCHLICRTYLQHLKNPICTKYKIALVSVKMETSIQNGWLSFLFNGCRFEAAKQKLNCFIWVHFVRKRDKVQMVNRD